MAWLLAHNVLNILFPREVLSAQVRTSWVCAAGNMSIKVYQNVLNFARTAESFLFLDGAGCSAEIPEDFWQSLASCPENVQRLVLCTHRELHSYTCLAAILRRCGAGARG